MTLTLGHGPLSRDPAAANYTVDGPAHKIFVERSGKRLRIEIAGQTVADTTRAVHLHETGLLPAYYVPVDDVRRDLFSDSDKHTTCPFKGEASYLSFASGDRAEANIAWFYPQPLDGVAAIADHVAFYLNRVDAVYEEAVRLVGHPRDPYHRVDTLRSDRKVTVRLGDRVIAETSRPMGVFETGLAPRWYIPRSDVIGVELAPSQTVSVCPYKGVATWWSIDGGPADVAWSYDEPLPEALGLADHVSFDGDDIAVDVAV